MTSFIQTTRARLFTAAALSGLLSIASAQESPQPNTPPSSSDIVDPAISLAAKDWVALRAWFHQPSFNVSDGLDDYGDDYRSIAALASVKLTFR